MRAKRMFGIHCIGEPSETVSSAPRICHSVSVVADSSLGIYLSHEHRMSDIPLQHLASRLPPKQLISQTHVAQGEFTSISRQVAFLSQHLFIRRPANLFSDDHPSDNITKSESEKDHSYRWNRFFLENVSRISGGEEGISTSHPFSRLVIRRFRIRFTVHSAFHSI